MTEPTEPTDQPGHPDGTQGAGGTDPAVTRHPGGDDTPGDPALAAVTDRFVGLLGADNLVEFSLTPFDHVGVPVWQSWWSEGERTSGGIGYGPTQQRARVGALGECVEHATAARSLPSSRLEEGSLAELRARLGEDAVVDPRTLGLPAGVDFDDDRPLVWWPTRRLRDDATVWAPAEFVASSGGELPAPPPGGWLTTPVSNGLGAGSTRAQAVSHAVLEIFQRDGNGLTFRALDAGRVVELDEVTDPSTLVVLGALRSAGVDVTVKLGATDFGVPNLYVVGTGPGDDVVVATACGEAAHPDREVALSKAVLEFASARARKAFMHGPLERVHDVAPDGYDAIIAAMRPENEEQRVLDAMVEWLRMPEETWRPLVGSTVLRRDTTTAFSSLPTTTVEGHDALLADVAGRLAAEGFDVLVHDLVDERGADAGVQAVKALVPGLEVETVAYGRIGERNAARLVALGRDDLLRVGDRPGDGWSRVHLTAAGRERLGGDAWLDRRAVDAVAADLLPLYREPGRHTAQQVLSAGGGARV
ncbi:YcaO-like family protein [Terracoccus luteus]|uniref:Ribosomal protein S12 methylthiotransferase accessory factor n=1 Tax=Terracoccus luteus TaxID=53356 RepID=A0A839PR11_9MICO|nr:YcaO-like family protein [Terracoccus luteus]MBB2986718.1 ribosomal protein S12 methylthiotransferase accessory factor [Terracoccus luteus]MCP2172369.1 ribosomal protein S12 methylthiotransferase accessory factor [Terracoccus luteus]